MAGNRGDILRPVVFLASALLIAGGALYLLYGMLNGLDRRIAAELLEGEKTSVVVASRTLYQGVQITKDDLFVIEIPPEYMPFVKDEETGKTARLPVFSSRDRVIGQIPRERILPNEFIRPDRLADGAAGVGLNAVIPRGMRAVSVNLRDHRALGSFLQPGNYVDVLVTMKDDGGQFRTETILQAVFVLGVNSRLASESEEEAQNRGKQKESVTFMVTPRQAEQIAYADELGEITLSLRNVQDVNYKSLSGADIDSLLARLKPKAPKPVTSVTKRPAKKPQETFSTVRVIKGSEASDLKYKDNP